MFLKLLNVDAKEKFLKLCVFASNSNGFLENEERLLIFEYCREMNLKEEIPELTESFEDLMSEMNDVMSLKEKKIVLLEILALIKCDGVYDKKEKEFMEKIISKFGFEDIALGEYNDLLEKYMQIGKELFELISK